MSDGTTVEMAIRALRKEYHAPRLREEDVAADPIAQFEVWLSEAVAAGLPEANAMTVATVDAEGHPTARVVLLKGVDARGFVFFTNYQSAKGRDLATHPYAALVFYWPGLGRQVRVTGPVAELAPEESDAYFATRPRGSQLGAWASPQSAIIPSRESLEARVAELAAEFEGRTIPRPPSWGGYRVTPERIEFWQGQPDRLHDRLRYTRRPDGGWMLERLAP